jgi:hypothetical protein
MLLYPEHRRHLPTLLLDHLKLLSQSHDLGELGFERPVPTLEIREPAQPVRPGQCHHQRCDYEQRQQARYCAQQPDHPQRQAEPQRIRAVVARDEER